MLKEGIVEEKTYLNTPPEGTVIKAPGLVTGSVEVVATKVTDLTTLATGVYDLATDKKARSDAYKGLVKIKESIGNDANTFIPILADVLLSAFSGNTAQDWKSLKESKTDEGKKSHLFTRGTENTVISGVVGVAFVKELPELAEKVSEKIGKVKNIGDELTTQLLKSGEDFTVLTNARKLPGVSSGGGKNITGTWLRGTERNAGLFPKSVADKLKGKTFTSFDDFRNQFWKAVADEQSLASQFDANSIQRMQGGLAPFTDVSQQIGGMKNYVLHHKTPINQGGAVYDMDNLYIVTPKYHKEILDPAYHYGYGY